MMPVAGKTFIDRNRLGRIVEVRLDIVVAQYSIHFRHIERAVPKRHAVRHVEPRRDRYRFAIGACPVGIRQRINLSTVHSADEQGSARGQGHGASVWNIREGGNLKPGRQFNLIERHLRAIDPWNHREEPTKDRDYPPGKFGERVVLHHVGYLTVGIREQ